MPPSLFRVSALDNELVGSCLLIARLVTECGLAPRGNRCRTSDRGASLTASVRVIARVHNGTANCRTDTLVTGLTCFTDLNGVVLDVADLTDGSAAVHTDVTDFAGGQTNLSHLAFLSHKLSLGSCGADELSAAAGIKLDVVDKRTDRDVCDRKGVAGFDICIGTGVEYISVGYAERSDDVALLAFVVLKKCDVSGAVRIVLDSDNRSLLIDIALEVDDTSACFRRRDGER